MALNKIRLVAQVVGFAALMVLGLLGVLALAGRGIPAWASPTQASLSGVPNVFNYQGMLRHPDGSVVNGSYTMTFNLYDQVLDGTLWHSEVLTDVVVRDGLFTVLLGDTTPIPAAAFGGPLYMGIQVGDDGEMQPRQRIAPVPYAFQAQRAYQADRAYGLSAADGDPADAVTVDNAGNVGVGTSPVARLTVQGDERVRGESCPNTLRALNSVTVGASNPGEPADVTLDSAGNIAWTGQLKSFQIQAGRVATCTWQDGCSDSEDTDLLSMSDGFCFLNFVKISTMSSDLDTDYASCELTTVDGKWVLRAHQRNGSGAECRATCILY